MFKKILFFIFLSFLPHITKSSNITQQKTNHLITEITTLTELVKQYSNLYAYKEDSLFVLDEDISVDSLNTIIRNVYATYPHAEIPTELKPYLEEAKKILKPILYPTKNEHKIPHMVKTVSFASQISSQGLSTSASIKTDVLPESSRSQSSSPENRSFYSDLIEFE